MKKTIQLLCATALAALCTVPAMAQLNGTGFYRFRNADRTTDYISMANDKFNYTTCIGSACGGLTQAISSAGQARALACAGKYLSTDIKMVNDDDIINPATIIFAQKYSTQASNHDYNLIGQGTSLLTLTTATYPGTKHLEFSDRYVTIDPVGGSGENTLYTAKIELKSSTYVYIPFIYDGYPSLGIRYLVDNAGTLDMSENSSAQNAKWYIEPITHFNVMPEFELNGRYYTTLFVPFNFRLSGQVLNAYSIKSVDADGTLRVELIATASEIVPACTPVILECGTDDAHECQLIPLRSTTEPISPVFTQPDITIEANAPVANENVADPTNNLLRGTYYNNTDGSISYTTSSGTGSFNADKNVKPTNPQKYVIGMTESGKLGFVKATSSTMPANKAWLEPNNVGVFPIVATPVIEPASGTYAEAQTVTITAEEGTIVYYTTDGSEPTTASAVYSEPFTVSETATVKAIAMKDGLYNNSEIATADYVIEIPVTVLPGDVNDDHKVSIKDVTELINYLLTGFCDPFNADNADVNQDGQIAIKDVTALINILLSSGGQED